MVFDNATTHIDMSGALNRTITYSCIQGYAFTPGVISHQSLCVTHNEAAGPWEWIHLPPNGCAGNNIAS